MDSQLTKSEGAENRLKAIISESGLEAPDAQKILNRFADSFELAEQWAARAKEIVVTDASHTDAMALAKTGRLLLRERRIAIESSRKEMKVRILQEGRAVDAIAKYLNELIVPTEKYLLEQEKFVEIKLKAEAAETERIRREAEEAEVERLRLEAIEADRLMREENERLRLEAIENQKKIDRETELRQKAERDRRKADRRTTYAKQTAAKKVEFAEKIIQTTEAESEKLLDSLQESTAERRRLEGEVDAAGKTITTQKVELEKVTTESVWKAKAELDKIQLLACPKCGHKFTPAELEGMASDAS